MSGLGEYWIPLSGEEVNLVPLAARHELELVEAARERDTYRYTIVPDGPSETREYIAGLLDEARAGQCAPYAIEHSGILVGCTRLMSPRWFSSSPVPDVVEIGGTWLAESVQRSSVNSATKWTLLRYCFEEVGIGRVEFKTDLRNERSRRALARLGAHEEGVLRRAHPSLVRGEEGRARDSVMFSLLATEWPLSRESSKVR
ncbi:MAG: GNAT family N-acetyltransferase [Acidimicrobiaceae bacterium]|nr:GNAT family N-acetyltransferase [Acidimicrobiaceae bacterium]